ncbi:MAG TPA: WGR domain-containing protein [Candidatus Binatia bacterium]|jgi:hypothetical protein
MLKLYGLTDGHKEYWETWAQADGTHIVHWGPLGTRGQTKTLKSTFLRKAEDLIQKEIYRLTAEGYRPMKPEDHARLLVEYAVEGMGTTADVDKRHRLEARMNETLGWTCLGACDGGSIGSGTMEVCNFVVDFELAKDVIAKDLAATEFSNFTRIYNEDA